MAFLLLFVNYKILFFLYSNNSKLISLNVPAVSDVFLRPMRKNAKHFYGRKKMWRSKTTQRGVAPTDVLRSLVAVRRRTLTDLLHDEFFTPTTTALRHGRRKA
jgi:hypothetical protein